MINAQGGASKKLRDFSLRYPNSIVGVSSSSSSSSSGAASNDHKRQRVIDKLEDVFRLSAELGIQVSRARVYTEFGL